jgi:hypothetical protein
LDALEQDLSTGPAYIEFSVIPVFSPAIEAGKNFVCDENPDPFDYRDPYQNSRAIGA